MRYRKQTGSGDYQFGNGQMDFYRDVPQAVGQAVKTRLLLWLGEWFLNIDDGTPYMQGILGKKSQPVANDTIQTVALGTQGISNLTDYQSSIEPNSRSMSVQFKINTVYGPTVVTLQNYANY